jgi:hypothetical protein
MCRVIKAGNYVTTALEFVGISRSAFDRWMNIGEQEIERIHSGERPDARLRIFVKLFEEIHRARANAEVRSVMLVNKAAEDDWRAAAWYLERAQPERWGRKLKTIEHKGSLEVRQAPIDLSRLSDEALAELENAAEND